MWTRNEAVKMKEIRGYWRLVNMYVLRRKGKRKEESDGKA